MAAKLVIIAGPGAEAHTEIPLDEAFTVGREEPGHGNLSSDPRLSRHHARFTVLEHGSVQVEDLASTNGTFVNGERISQPRVLEPGDEIRLGTTTLRLQDETGGDATRVRPGPPPAETPTGPPVFTVPTESTDGRRGPARRGIVVVLALLAVAGAVVGIVLATRSGGAGASPASDCGSSIGRDDAVAYVTYVESNIAQSNKNSVIAIPYRAGDLKPLKMSKCPTGGSGSADLTDSGVLDANDQIAVNPQHTLLFAVNQGSDSIAVFHIKPNGGLEAVDGSPFPSGGKAPSSLGISGRTLVVANKAQDGIRDLTAERPDYTTFTIGADGTLQHVGGSTVYAKPGSSPTDASVPAEGGVAVGTEESGPIRSFTVAADGTLRQGPGSPYDPPAEVFGKGFDPSKEFALGVAPHPTLRLFYIGLPTVPALAVYQYDTSGRLEFRNAVLVSGAYLPCWIQVTKDGRWLYTANADTDNVTAFDIRDPLHPKQIQTLAFQTPGNPWNEGLSPDGKYLFVNTPRDTLKVPEGEGNTQHVMRVGDDGKLTELRGTSPTELPVPESANPQGIAVVVPAAS